MTRRVIVAVFGPSRANPYAATAEALGRRIVADAVLLTGGTGVVDGSVKEQATEGAERALAAGAAGGWIGVAKRDVPVRAPRHGRGLVVRTPYGHERNYVNALLCDAAVALRGERGTESEVAFCVALGRPVVLLGPAWGEIARRFTDPAAAREAVTAMIDRLFPPGEAGTRMVDRAIQQARSAPPSRDPRLELLTDLEATEQAVTTALHLASARPAQPDDPAIAELLDPATAHRLAQWLADLGSPSA